MTVIADDKHRWRNRPSKGTHCGVCGIGYTIGNASDPCTVIQDFRALLSTDITNEQREQLLRGKWRRNGTEEDQEDDGEEG